MNQRRRINWGNVARATMLLVLAIGSLFPIYWMVTGSFKTMTDTMAMPPEWVPKNPTLNNYQKLFSGRHPALRWTWNSIWTAALISLGSIITSAMAGYGFAKKQFPGRNILFWTLVATMTLPLQIKLIPLFVTMDRLGWVNTYLGVVAPFISYPMGVFLVRQFALGIPDDLLAAAQVDGASELRTFTTIVLPLLKPAIAAVGIFSFVFGWNQYMWQLVVLTDSQMYTLPVGVAKLSTSAAGTDLGFTMAAATVAFIPLLIIFLAFQKYFIRGITMGSIKG
ncbi:MAG: carbohydrate ABC transporter permease [Limnochorda sp.]|uniref:carbohydrate ABC transporter permease n=1 Tax=Limnochorda sp. TaxID=1940279 RepID=UPI0039C1A24C